jgi:hypothetical protein
MIRTVALAAALTLALGIQQASAHHGFDSEFDQNKIITISGVITKVDWINPHIYFTVAVQQPNGSFVQWQAESVPIALARQVGATAKSMLGDGRPVTVTGFASRKAPNFMFGNKVSYSDGRSLTWLKYKG